MFEELRDFEAPSTLQELIAKTSPRSFPECFGLFIIEAASSRSSKFVIQTQSFLTNNELHSAINNRKYYFNA